MVTRRGALAAGAAALVAGCGKGDAPPPDRAADARGGDSSLADVALLNDALAAERQTLGLLPRAREHVRVLEREILRSGGEPRPLEAQAPPADDPQAAAAELVALYVDLLAKLAEPRLRGTLARLLADAAGALAEQRQAAGADPAPSAFVAGARPEER